MVRHMANIAALSALAMAGSAWGATAPGKAPAAAVPAKGSAAAAPAKTTPAPARTAAAVPPAPANGSQVIHAVGIVDLQQFVTQHGDTVIGTGNNGAVTVAAKTARGLSYELVGSACKQPGVVGCESIFMQVKFAMKPTVTDATLSKANTNFAAVKVWKDAAGTVVGISRYMVLGGGVTRQNVLDNIELLVAMAPAAAQIAFGTAPAAAPAPAAKK